MGLWDDITGKTAADAARAAAADKFKKQTAATDDLKQFGSGYSNRFGELSHSFDPWAETGGYANDAVRRLLMDPSSIRSLPAYTTGVEEGTRAIDRSAVSNGRLFSGKTGKDLVRFGESQFDKTYGDQLARLLGVSQQGMDATGRGVATTGAGLQGELGARTSAYGGDMAAAGTIGEGDVAAANARAKGVGNLLNLGGSLFGTALSAGMGGGGFSSLLSGLGGGGGGFSAQDGAMNRMLFPGYGTG